MKAHPILESNLTADTHLADAALLPRQIKRFKELCWPHLQTVMRTAVYLCRNQTIAEDLAQDTMIKAARSIDPFTDGTNVRAWLLTILRRTHIDFLRRNRHRAGELSINAENARQIPEPITPATDPTEPRWVEPDQMLERFEDEDIVAGLKSLPDAIRWTLLLVDVEQLEHVQAARILDVPIGTIKSRAHRGRKMLKAYLQDHDHSSTHALMAG